MTSNSKKHGVDPTEKRRNRNRVSQRNFRERRDRYVKELEERVNTLGMNEVQRDAKLLQENAALRTVLHKTRSKLERLQTEIEELCAAMDIYSDLGNIHGERLQAYAKPDGVVESALDAMLLDRPRTDRGSTNTLESDTSHVDNGVQIEIGFAEESDSIAQPRSAPQRQECPLTYEGILLPDHANCVGIDAVDPYFTGPGISPPQLHGDFFDFLGSGFSTIPIETFGSSLLVSFGQGDVRLLQALYFMLDREFAASQHASLSLSDHIDKVIAMVRDYLKLVGGLSSYTQTSQACMTAMVVFARYISPLPATMWFTSYCYQLVERVMFWQVHRTADCSRSSIPAYEPSALQLSTKHSSLIDWIVLAPLRDRLIVNYNKSRNLDKVFVDLMKHTVIEVSDLSKILTGVSEGPGYLGVWNLFNAMNLGFHEETRAVCKENTIELFHDAFAGLIQMHKMPPPDDTWVCQVTCSENGFWQPVSFGDLMGSPQIAKQLYHFLRVYDSHKHWKIDPMFYEIYPELKYEAFEASCAQGTNYRLTSSWVELSSQMQSM
ncbi:hypothetical protein BKA66DRAFT_289034 [Pyrenochaeta sp. MPI-SDFR-AT-0127]|nr:hypothetical protein BKA66DRAFT_289034 [Pyrenochaeta sp. MPI-SDFR-AT-0127]